MTDKEHGGSLSRVKADIADLHLPSLPALQGGVNSDLSNELTRQIKK